MVEIELSENARQELLSKYYSEIEQWINRRRDKSKMFRYYKLHLNIRVR